MLSSAVSTLWAEERALERAFSEMKAGNWEDALRLAKVMVRSHGTSLNGIVCVLGRAPRKRRLSFGKEWRLAWIAYLQAQSEVALGDANEQTILTYFENSAPKTGAGALAYALALSKDAQGNKAALVAQNAWITLTLTAPQQDAFCLFGSVLMPLHELRLIEMLWMDEHASAQQMEKLVGADLSALLRAGVHCETGKRASRH